MYAVVEVGDEVGGAISVKIFNDREEAENYIRYLDKLQIEEEIDWYLKHTHINSKKELKRLYKKINTLMETPIDVILEDLCAYQILEVTPPKCKYEVIKHELGIQ